MNAHIIKLEYEDGKKLNYPTVWCGASINTYTDWHFKNAQHALLSIDQGSMIDVCPACLKSIKDLIK